MMPLGSVLGCGTWFSLIEEQLYWRWKPEVFFVCGRGGIGIIQHDLRSLEWFHWLPIIQWELLGTGSLRKRGENAENTLKALMTGFSLHQKDFVNPSIV
jgi:hypothetical protein